ncbi:MAG: hypothetical protein RDU76_11435 [Candidatus Edwardsbacteria bacterium]|nr:hypothetical protein [Candidatus Edwardsbacteria bacterium]
MTEINIDIDRSPSKCKACGKTRSGNIINGDGSRQCFKCLGEAIKHPRRFSFKRQCKRLAMELGKEKRQQILDKLHQGKSLGEIAREELVDLDAVVGVFTMNTKKIEYLAKESV